MLKLELLTAEIDKWALLKKEVQLEEVGVKGLSAQLFKSKSDSVANYQFVLDAFKSKRNTKEKKGEKSDKLVFNLEQLHAEDVDIVYNNSHFSFVSANLSKGWGGSYYAELHKAETSWVHVKKRHPVRVDNHLMIGRVISTSKITGRTLLKDISHPFAPVLKDFKEPLLVSTRFSGNDNSLAFKDVVVRTTDNKLHIKAVGGLNNLKDKYKLRVHFNILDCVAKDDSKTRIINQFRVRKFMMKQVQTLGTLHYRGGARCAV